MISTNSGKSIVLSTSLVVNATWDWGTCTSFSPRYSLHFFLRMRRGEAAAVQTLSGFYKATCFLALAGWLQVVHRSEYRGVLSTEPCKSQRGWHFLAHAFVHFILSRCQVNGARTGTSSCYFLLVCVSQCNVQLVELFVSVSMVGVCWALTEASAQCLISDLWRNFISCYVFLQENPNNILEGKLFCPISPFCI